MKRKSSWIWFFLVILWMSVIFLFSAQNAERSAAMSGGITEQIVRFFYQDFDRYFPAQQEEIMGNFTFLVRKAAHFTEYAVLGFLLAGWLHSFSVPALKWPVTKNKTAWIIGTIYAVSDEVHQMFSDGRAPRLFDVCVDSVGTASGILVFFLVCHIWLWYTESMKVRNRTEI